jgi:hypothetical protein
MRLTGLSFIHVSTIHSAGVAGSLGVMSANGLSYTVGKTPEQRASSANCRNSVGQMDATVANPQPPLFTVSSSSVFQLFRPDGRE